MPERTVGERREELGTCQTDLAKPTGYPTRLVAPTLPCGTLERAFLDDLGRVGHDPCNIDCQIGCENPNQHHAARDEEGQLLVMEGFRMMEAAVDGGDVIAQYEIPRGPLALLIAVRKAALAD